jgi:hypothetical protein
MRRSHFAALAGLLGATLLGGCVTQSPPPAYSYSYSSPGSYSGPYPVSHTYPNGYSAAYSPDYNGSYNTYNATGGHGG